jgi:hypothetical protein
MDPAQEGWAQMFSSVGTLVTPNQDYATEHCYEKVRVLSASLNF